MTEKSINLIVSILNLELENLGYNVDDEGFRYDPDTLEISTCEGDLEEDLQYLFEDLCKEYRNK